MIKSTYMGFLFYQNDFIYILLKDLQQSVKKHDSKIMSMDEDETSSEESEEKNILAGIRVSEKHFESKKGDQLGNKSDAVAKSCTCRVAELQNGPKLRRF